jgi:hypothetical protein
MATQPRAKSAAIPPVSAISPGIASPVDVQEQLVQEQIRVRAYQLYEERGKIDGHELEDWLQAEAELRPSVRVAA